MRIEVWPGGTVVLQRSVLNEAVRRRVVDMVQNTIGVTSVIEELAVVKDGKAINAKPARWVIESKAWVTTETRSQAEP
jgi:hypothetical protein